MSRFSAASLAGRGLLLAVVLVGGISAAGCNKTKRLLGGGGDGGGYSARSANIFGDWVLSSSPDSTAFAGARLVEMRLSQTAFSLTAYYIGRPSQTVSGSASLANGGMLTLTPETGSAGGFAAGSPVTLIATAADNTLLFSPPQQTIGVESSFWISRDAAVRSGKIPRGTPPAP